MDNLITWPYVRKEEEERLRQLDREKQRRIQELPPLPLRILPLPREDLASVLSRAARRMGYEKPEWLLRLESVPHKINPDNLPLLHRQKDYLLLKRLLLLEEEEIYALTLHCFAQHFSQDVWLLSAMHKDVQQSINRAGLSYEYGHQFFLTQRYTKVCPLCLDEEDGYGRLFWRCTLILYCPRHRVLLVHSCPTCKGPIPALRPSLTLCPACKTGDYRMCLHPILPEDLWLESGHRSLLRHLGIDEAEVGTPLVASEETALERLPTYDYFVVLSICLSFSKLYSLSDERISRFLVRELPLEMVETRFTQSLGRSSHENLSPILIHYLSSAWPLHVLAFLKCLQRLLQEAFHYAPQSAVVQRWSQAIVQGNYWCALSYREQPVSQLMNLYRVCEQRFKSLPVAEREEDYQGGEVVNERLILKREAEITPLDKAILPHHWESLPSIMARVADVMGYRRMAITTSYSICSSSMR